MRRSEEHTSELQSLAYLVCRLLLEKKKNRRANVPPPCDTASRTAPCTQLPSAAFFFFNYPPTTDIYTLSLHHALPIFLPGPDGRIFAPGSDRSSRKTRPTGRA